MKILAIGTDRKLFEEGSAVAARQIKYGQLFDRLDIIVYSLRSIGLQPKKLSDTVTIYPTNSASRFLYFLDAAKLAATLQKPDVVTAQDPFESGVGAYLAAWRSGAPLHLQVHTDFLSPYFFHESALNKIRVLIAKFLVKRAAGVRVVSERIKQSILAAGLIGEEKVRVLPIFVDAEQIRGAEVKIDLHKKYPQFEFIILMASRITEEKNIGLAIEAMREVVKGYPRAGLVIVGDGPEKNSLQSIVESYGLEQNIIMEGWTSELPSYYKTADLFLLTSNYEGYGLTVAESLAAGTPVAMTDVGCAGELLHDSENGLIFKVGDASGAAAAITRYIENNDLRQSIKNNIAKMPPMIAESEYLLRYNNLFS